MQAPDGNYEDGFTLPGQSRPPTPTPSGEAFERNNPLSLDEQVREPTMLLIATAYRLLFRIPGSNGF